MRAKNILLENRKFLEKAAKKLAVKETLLYSDIRRIRVTEHDSITDH